MNSCIIPAKNLKHISVVDHLAGLGLKEMAPKVLKWQTPFAGTSKTIGPGPVGSREYSRDKNRVSECPSAKVPTSPIPSQRTGQDPDQGRAAINAGKGSNCGASTLGGPEGLLLEHISSTQRGESEACDQPQGSQPVRKPPTLQNGGYTYSKGPDTVQRLDDQNRSEGCLLLGPNSRGTPEVPKVHSREPSLSVHLPSLWSVKHPLDLYQGSEASGGQAQRARGENGNVPGRHTDNGELAGDGTRTYSSSNLPLGEPGFLHQCKQIRDPTHSAGGVSGHDPGFLKNVNQDPGGRKVESRCKECGICSGSLSKGAFSATGEDDGHVAGDPTGADSYREICL